MRVVVVSLQLTTSLEKAVTPEKTVFADDFSIAWIKSITTLASKLVSRKWTKEVIKSEIRELFIF